MSSVVESFFNINISFNVSLSPYSGLLDKLKGEFSRPANAPIGPVPAFNPDLVPLLTPLKRSKDNFYIPTDADYSNMLEHLLVVAYGTAEVIAHAPSEKERFLASQSLFSLGHVFERLTDFRRRNWFRELPGSLRYASLLSEVPSHGQFLFREIDRATKEVKLLSATEVTDHCEKAKEAYKKLRTSTYVFLVSVQHVLPDFYPLFVFTGRIKRTRSVRETGSAGAAGARVAPARDGRTRTTAKSSTRQKRRTTTTRTIPVPLPRRNAGAAAAVEVADAGAARRRRKRPSNIAVKRRFNLGG